MGPGKAKQSERSAASRQARRSSLRRQGLSSLGWKNVSCLEIDHLTKLHIADKLSLPLNAVTQKLAMLGRTGSGKTYGATKLAEEMLDAGAQIVALDPVGAWYGLRLAANGRDAGIAIPVFGGLHGDVPLEPSAGALIADLIVDRGISAICDVSQFEHDTEKARFGRDFAARFFYRKKSAPSAVHVFMEECRSGACDATAGTAVLGAEGGACRQWPGGEG